jgi:hypothetical protein
VTNLSNCAKKYRSSNVYARKISCAVFILFNFYIHLRFCVSTNLTNEFYFQMQVKAYLFLTEVIRCFLKKQSLFSDSKHLLFLNAVSTLLFLHGIRICKEYRSFADLVKLAPNFHPFYSIGKASTCHSEKKD